MIKILLTGEGGQGVQTVAKIITEAAQKSGKKTSYIPSFGVEQRGGVSLAYIRIADETFPYARFEQADIIVCFCDRAVPVVKKFIQNETLFIFDSSAIHDKILDQVKDVVKKYLPVPAQKIAREKYSTKVLNMIFTGALIAQLKEINFQKAEEAILETLGAKIAADPKMKDLNFGALHEGMQAVENFDSNQSEFEGIEIKEIQQEFSDDKKTWTRFPEYCKGCALCIVRCPVNAIKFSDKVGFLGNPLPIVDIQKCIACGMCEKTCPDGAIRVDKK